MTESAVLFPGTESTVLFESHVSSTHRRSEWHVSNSQITSPPPTSQPGRRTFLPSRLSNFALELFLPVGFPSSVRPGYISYQLWDGVQGLCTYLRFTLAIKSLLDGLGVGSSNASAVAGSVLWAAKDGTRMIANLAFSWSAATEMGRNVRQWRLVADLANDIMLTLQVCAPMFGIAWFAPLTCLSSVFAAVCGASAAATKTSISEHFAKISLSDLVTKEGTQETAVTLLGLVWGSALVHWLGDSDAADRMSRLWGVFSVLTLLHIYANVRAVSTLQFHRVNDIRFSILYQRFFDGDDMSVVSVAAAEPRLPVNLFRKPNVVLGGSMREVERAVRPETLCAALSGSKSGQESAFLLLDGEERHSRLSYSRMAYPVVHALLSPDVEGEDLLRARFEAQSRIDEGVGCMSGHTGDWTDFRDRLVQLGWDIDRPLVAADLWRYDWK